MWELISTFCKLLSLFLPTSNSKWSLSLSLLDGFPSKHMWFIWNLSTRRSGAKGYFPGLDLDVSIRPGGHQTFLWIQGAWMPRLVRLKPGLCWDARAASWCHIRTQSPCQGRFMGWSHWQVCRMGSQERGDSWHALATHKPCWGITSDTVSGGRQGKSQMTPEEQENWLTYFLLFLFLQCGDNFGTFCGSSRRYLNCCLQRGCWGSCLPHWRNRIVHTEENWTFDT